MADINALIRNPLVLGGAAVVVIGAALGGYFLWMKPAARITADGKPIPSLCEATLARAADYGVVERDAKLVSTDAASTPTKDRMVCQAKYGATTYSMTVDVACDDMSNQKCLQVFSITDSAGATLFRRSRFQDE